VAEDGSARARGSALFVGAWTSAWVLIPPPTPATGYLHPLIILVRLPKTRAAVLRTTSCLCVRLGGRAPLCLCLCLCLCVGVCVCVARSQREGATQPSLTPGPFQLFLAPALSSRPSISLLSRFSSAAAHLPIYLSLGPSLSTSLSACRVSRSPTKKGPIGRCMLPCHLDSSNGPKNI
jgi:hypothetical protein